MSPIQIAARSRDGSPGALCAAGAEFASVVIAICAARAPVRGSGVGPVDCGEMSVAARILEFQPMVVVAAGGSFGGGEPARKGMADVFEPYDLVARAGHARNRDVG